MAEPVKRFVILHHTGCDRPHWDFLLEQDESLATWQLYHDPLAEAKEEWELSRIADHRKFYLDHEGPVPGNRGEVRRVCGGTYDLPQRNSQCWRVQLASSALAGEFELREAEGERWLRRKVGG